LHITSAHDSGRIINPTLAESQLEGGIIQGLAMRCSRSACSTRRSVFSLNPNTHDYKMPTIADVPTIDAFFVDSSDIVANHVGARGIAEAPIIPTAPAIANAVADALGCPSARIPLTPWRVLAALKSE
jgi:CO/xanthine dehydrogenase Mo-binding subunit